MVPQRKASSGIIFSQSSNLFVRLSSHDRSGSAFAVNSIRMRIMPAGCGADRPRFRSAWVLSGFVGQAFLAEVAEFTHHGKGDACAVRWLGQCRSLHSFGIVLLAVLSVLLSMFTGSAKPSGVKLALRARHPRQ